MGRCSAVAINQQVKQHGPHEERILSCHTNVAHVVEAVVLAGSSFAIDSFLVPCDKGSRLQTIFEDTSNYVGPYNHECGRRDGFAGGEMEIDKGSGGDLLSKQNNVFVGKGS